MRLLTTCAALCAVTATSLAAQTMPMQDDPKIRQGFYDFYLAREIEDNCPDLSLRRFRLLGFYNSMISYARSAGYSRADFDAMEDNDAVKDAFKAELRGDLAERGAVPGNAAGYCKVGREEIARGSQAGSFLKD